MLIYFAGNFMGTTSGQGEQFPRSSAARELLIVKRGARRRLMPFYHTHDLRYLEEWLKLYRRQGLLR